MRFDLPMMADMPAGGGEPLRLPLGDIDEDPAQPRSEFDDSSLRELAATIAERGVRQPVSVRPHPVVPGRWMLNFGARRLRAARIAGLADVPAFVDAQADSYDQVIENEQREGLKPIELALFVQRRLAAGESQAHIARALGKSRSYLTFIAALIDAPDWLLALYRGGRCRGITELYELRRLSQSHGDVVRVWAANREDVVRRDVEAFKATLERRSDDGDTQQPSRLPEPRAERIESAAISPHAETSIVTGTRRATVARPMSSDSCDAAPNGPEVASCAGPAVLWARYQGEGVMIELSSLPGEQGTVFVRRQDGVRCVARIVELQLTHANRANRASSSTTTG